MGCFLLAEAATPGMHSKAGGGIRHDCTHGCTIDVWGVFGVWGGCLVCVCVSVCVYWYMDMF